MNFLQRTFIVVLLVGVSSIRSENSLQSEILSYVNVLTCAVNAQPWECVYQRSGKMLDSIQDALVRKENQLKAQADAEFASKFAARGFSETDVTEKDKPSTVLTTLENYVTNGVKNIMARARGDRRKDKRKKKKKPQIELVAFQKPEVYELADQSTGHKHGHMHGGGHGGHGGNGGHLHGGGHGGGGHLHGGHQGLGLHGLKFKKKYGRSIGVKRGKGKKKKRKAIMKLLLIGAVLKAKIELLLKVISTHLQLKFFIVAVIGLLVNVARFWVDLKRGHQPQKVVYYEQAHHQHVYDEHDDGWGGSGSYWKRSLTGSNSAESASASVPIPEQLNISYDRNGGPISNSPPSNSFVPDNYRTYDEHMSGYNGGSAGPQLPTFTDPHSIVYSKQMPQQTYSFN